jgi:hypothetical protein
MDFMDRMEGRTSDCLNAKTAKSAKGEGRRGEGGRRGLCGLSGFGKRPERRARSDDALPFGSKGEDARDAKAQFKECLALISEHFGLGIF